MIFNKREQKQPEKIYSIAITLTDNTPTKHMDASSIKIFGGCLIVVDPLNEIPCEVHCYPLSSIKSFIFDVEAVKDGKVNITMEDLFDVGDEK